MPLFSYTAVDEKGKQVKGELASDSQQHAVTDLKLKRLFPVGIKEISYKEKKSIWQKEIIKQRIRKKDLAIFTRQFASMLHAGVPLPTIMDVLIKQEKNTSLKEILESINADILKGNTLSEAMKKFKVFPPLLTSMVEVGEANGRLDMSFERIAVNMEKDIKLTSKIKGAMIYPIVLLCLTIAVAIVLTVVVMPTFTKMFKDMNVELPATTKAFLGLSSFIRNYWYLILVGIFIIVFAFYKVLKEPQIRKDIDRLLLKVPVIGKLQNTIIMARFCRTFSALVEAGVGVVISLETVKNVFNNLYIKNCFDDIILDVQSGANISLAVSKHNIFTPLVVSMLRIGEESGRLGDVLTRTAELYEEESDAQLQRATAMMEPMITIFMALGVGFIIISIIQPMFKMYGNLNK